MAAMDRCAHRTLLFTIGLAAALVPFTLTAGGADGSTPHVTTMSVSVMPEYELQVPSEGSP